MTNYETLMKLARRTLWNAYMWNDHVWNDHNFADHIQRYSKKECESLGIKDFKQANEFLCKPDPLVLFANELIDGGFEGCGFDGCDIQDIAAKHGLLELKTMNYPCGDNCSCACVGSIFPTECYQKSEMLKCTLD